MDRGPSVARGSQEQMDGRRRRQMEERRTTRNLEFLLLSGILDATLSLEGDNPLATESLATKACHPAIPSLYLLFCPPNSNTIKNHHLLVGDDQ